MTQNVSYSDFFDEDVEVQRKQILNIKFKGGSDDSFQSVLKHFPLYFNGDAFGVKERIKFEKYCDSSRKS